MDVRQMPMRLFGAIAAFVLALVLTSFVPSVANAHAGHSHAKPSQTTQSHKAVEPMKADVPAAPVQQFVSSYVAPSHAADETDCGTRGCCSNGPCTACHGFVGAVSPVTMPPLLSSRIVARETLPRGSPELERFRRPPKSFA